MAFLSGQPRRESNIADFQPYPMQEVLENERMSMTSTSSRSLASIRVRTTRGLGPRTLSPITSDHVTHLYLVRRY